MTVLMFVEPEKPSVSLHRRKSGGGFAIEHHLELDAVIPLPEIDASLALADLYDRVKFARTADDLLGFGDAVKQARDGAKGTGCRSGAFLNWTTKWKRSGEIRRMKYLCDSNVFLALAVEVDVSVCGALGNPHWL